MYTGIETPYLNPNTRRTVIQWQEYFGTPPDVVAAFVAANALRFESSVLKSDYMDACVPAPVLEKIAPNVVSNAAVSAHPIEVVCEGFGFTMESRIVVNGAETYTHYRSPRELTTGISGQAVRGPVPVLIRTPNLKDSNALTFTVNP
jgi:hypothetical protein